MDIENLIEILLKAKNSELKEVKILRKESTIDCCYAAEDITGFSYDFNNDSLILFPAYF